MNSNLIVSFTGVGLNNVLNSNNDKEFKKLLSYKDHDTHFFIDKNRSWFNDVNIFDLTIKSQNYKNIITIGNSMGGFNAVVAANYIKVNTVIAFAAQYSVHPDIVPWENRWIEYRKKITTWKHKKMNFLSNVNYFFIYGDELLEQKHMDMIPDLNNITKIIIPNSGHNVASDLKKQNKLYPLITNIIEKRTKL